jgi:protein required for attachment to host cells
MHSPGNGHRASQPKTDPKTNEARHFAQELARELNHGRASGLVERLILVAPPAFMGLLNEKLDGPTHLVSDRFEKDYTKAGEKELAGTPGVLHFPLISRRGDRRPERGRRYSRSA